MKERRKEMYPRSLRSREGYRLTRLWVACALGALRDFQRSRNFSAPKNFFEVSTIGDASMGYVTEALAVADHDAGGGVAARILYATGQVMGSITSLNTPFAYSLRHTGYSVLTIQDIVHVVTGSAHHFSLRSTFFLLL